MRTKRLRSLLKYYKYTCGKHSDVFITLHKCIEILLHTQIKEKQDEERNEEEKKNKETPLICMDSTVTPSHIIYNIHGIYIVYTYYYIQQSKRQSDSDDYVWKAQ